MTMHPLLQRQQYLLVLAIERCALPLPTKKVLLEVLSTCAETARQQQAEGTTLISLGCRVSLEQWATRLTLKPATLLQALHVLLEDGYLHHDPDEPFADGAWLTWNLAFDTWPCFAPRPKRPHVRQVRAEVEADPNEDASEQPPWSRRRSWRSAGRGDLRARSGGCCARRCWSGTTTPVSIVAGVEAG